MKVLVTGAAGHVGGNLVRALLERGVSVRALVRSDVRALDGLDIEHVVGDLDDPESLRAAVSGVQQVLHCAAFIDVEGREEPLMHAVNVEGTRCLLEASMAAGVERFVHVSTVHTLNPIPKDQPLTETRPLNDGPGAHPYERTKSLGELEVLKAVEKGLHAVIVNPTGIIGPHDYKPSRMGAVLLQLSRGELPALVHGGYNWVDVRDVSDTIIRAAEKGRVGERYLVGGRWMGLPELAELARPHMSSPPPRFSVPLWMAWVGVPFSVTWAWIRRERPLFSAGSMHMLTHQCRDVSSDKAIEELGHSARPIEETLADTFDWFREHGLLGEGSR